MGAIPTHQALKQLRDQCMRRKMRWVLDADIQGCFDNFDHGILRELLTRRIKDKNIMRLINQWLRTGVVDGKSMQRNTKGTPQGNIISPLMCNVYMHYVIDRFRARRRCLPGDANHTKKNGEIRPDDSSGKEPSV